MPFDENTAISKSLGVVVIGRNEGDRLILCLSSVLRSTDQVVYVDSGSTDQSADRAAALGADVVLLDSSIPFTAARGRNAGFERLRERWPHVKYLQFVDGDCEIIDGWLQQGHQYLEANEGVGAVCGRLHERYPDRSIYNRLCDAEWDRPAGEITASGGIAMMRCEAFELSGKFRSDLVAGEEPELCSRLIDRGWKIYRLAVPMAWHDAAILNAEQWWMRTRRSGFGSAALAEVPGYRDAVTLRRRNLGTLVWALVIPFIVLVAILTLGPFWLVLLGIYPLQIVRIAGGLGSFGKLQNWEVAIFTILGKFPWAIGLIQFQFRSMVRDRNYDFDYKRH